MSDPNRELEDKELVPHQTQEEEPRSKGPNLAVIYSLIALAIAAAMGVALMIVMPFYHRR